MTVLGRRRRHAATRPVGRLSRRPALAAVAVAVLAALALAGCGGSSGGTGPTASAASPSATPLDTGSGPVEGRTAAQILAASQAAAEAATSVAVAGKANGAQVDARLATDGADSRILNAGHLIQLLRVQDAVYVRGDDAFWTAQISADAAKVLHGKYVKLSPAQASGYSAFLDIGEFFGNTLRPQGSITKGAVVTVAGHRVMPLVDGTDGTVLTISLEGAPYPVMITKKGASGGTITFTKWGEPVTVTPPPAAQVVDLSQVSGG